MMSLCLSLLQFFRNFLWRVSVPDELIRGRNFNQDFSLTRSYWMRYLWGGAEGSEWPKDEGSRRLSFQLQERSSQVCHFSRLLCFYFYVFRNFLPTVLYLTSCNIWIFLSSVRIKSNLKWRSFCEAHDRCEILKPLKSKRSLCVRNIIWKTVLRSKISLWIKNIFGKVSFHQDYFVGGSSW